jgi:hypothetical protein
MLNMEALERALQSIEDTTHVESTFRVGGDDGVPVTLGLLLPEQEVEVQQYAQEALSEEEDDQEGNTKDEAMDFLDRWKYGILSYSVRQIGDLDFRGHEYVATGETLDNGTEVKVPKHVAVRKLLRKLWHRPVLNRVFHKYTELLEAGEAKAAKAIKYKPADLDAEIARREEELGILKAQKKQQDEGAPDPVGSQIKETSNLAQAADEAASPTRSAAKNIADGENRAARRKREREERKAKGKEKPPAEGRRSAIPTHGAAPARPAPAPEPAPAPAPPPPPADMGSFGDADDEAVIAAETQRLIAARAAAAAAEEEGTNIPGPEHEARVDAAADARRRAAGMVPREPPHRQAASTAAAVLDSGGGSIQPARPEHVGTIDGVDAHRIRPPETLTKRGGRSGAKPGKKKEGPALNQGPRGAANPRFKPSR